MRGAPRREFEAVKPPRTAHSHGPRRRSRLAARGSLSSERATLSRDGARIRRILAACRTQSGNVGRTQRVLTASGKSSISRTDERRDASFEPRASGALRPAVSSRGVAARAGRGTGGPSRSSAHGADCLRELRSLSAYVTGRAKLSRARGAQRRERRGSPRAPRPFSPPGFSRSPGRNGPARRCLSEHCPQIRRKRDGPQVAVLPMSAGAGPDDRTERERNGPGVVRAAGFRRPARYRRSSRSA